MPWTSDQLPWTDFLFQKPSRPSGPFEPLNYFKGPPILSKGGLYGHPSGPPVLVGGSAATRSSGPPIMVGGGGGSGSSGGPPIMLGRTGSTNTYGAPVKLTSTPVSLYGAPSVLAGVRIRGAKI